MKHTMTAAERLEGLLRWLNGRPGTDARRTITTFVASFDGSAAAGYLDTSPWDARPGFLQPAQEQLTDDQLQDLEARLRLLVGQGFGDSTLADLSFPAGSLHFAVRRSGRATPKWRNTMSGKRVLVGGAKALRDYHAAGAYVLRVDGAILELVPFLVANLLTQPDMVAVRRCPAPGCTNFFVTAPAERGRPKTFCSGSCRLRNAEQQPKPRRKR